MTEKQARQLLPQTVVYWDQDRTNRGTVRQVGYSGLYIDWEDCGLSFTPFNRCDQVHIY